jgi:hypothetical protein
MLGTDPDLPLPVPVAEPPGLTAEDEVHQRPPNAFILFYRAIHAAVITDNLHLPDLEVNRLIGRMWQSADEQTRSYYREQARTVADLFRQIHPDFDELKRKRINFKTASVKVPEPVRVKVILSDHDIGIPGPIPTSQVEMFD